MSIQPISSLTRSAKVHGVKRVTRRAKGENTEESAQTPVTAKRSNPPGVGENLDVTV